MAGTLTFEGADDRKACQGEIAQRSENLVADPLIIVTQAGFIHDTVLIQNNGIFKRATAPGKVWRLAGRVAGKERSEEWVAISNEMA